MVGRARKLLFRVLQRLIINDVVDLLNTTKAYTKIKHMVLLSIHKLTLGTKGIMLLLKV